MKFTDILFAPILKAVAALANNGGFFKRKKRTPFDLRSVLGFNYMPGMIGM